MKQSEKEEERGRGFWKSPCPGGPSQLCASPPRDRERGHHGGRTHVRPAHVTQSGFNGAFTRMPHQWRLRTDGATRGPTRPSFLAEPSPSRCPKLLQAGQREGRTSRHSSLLVRTHHAKGAARESRATKAELQAPGPFSGSTCSPCSLGDVEEGKLPFRVIHQCRDAPSPVMPHAVCALAQTYYCLFQTSFICLFAFCVLAL